MPKKLAQCKSAVPKNWGKPVIEFGQETYRIRAGRNISPAAEYGDPALLSAGCRYYVACIHETSDGERISLLQASDGEPVYVLQGFLVPDVKFDEFDDEELAEGRSQE